MLKKALSARAKSRAILGAVLQDPPGDLQRFAQNWPCGQVKDSSSWLPKNSNLGRTSKKYACTADETEYPELPVLPDWSGAINTLPCATPGLCRYHQGREGFPHVAEPRGGGQPSQQDSLQAAETRGGAKSGVQHLHRNFPSLSLLPGVAASLQNREVASTWLRPEVMLANQRYWWCGRELLSQPAHPDSQPSEHAPSGRPFLADSPPLQERSWVPTPTEIIWRPRHEVTNMISSTS